MDNIWKVYNTILEQSRDVSQLEKLASALNVKVAAKDLKSSDNRVTVKAIMSQWLPISRATLSMVADYTPSPLDIAEERVEALMCDHSVKFDSLHDETRALKSHFLKCSSEDSEPVIVYVSKMFAVDREIFPENQPG
ncbi:EFTUD1 [Bugula neritina]|uniref:EFTUD1 n=1 Tax=Bugula neritina TaxID=10212 RepID=A0A7J7KKD1_BUGNE|nr:EFTUD1 [Bugula neritina]